MRRRLLPVATATAVVAALLVAAPAAAQRTPAEPAATPTGAHTAYRVHAKGFGGDVDATIPAGGTATVTAGPLDKATKIGRIVLDGSDGSGGTNPLIDMVIALGRAPTPANRLLTCIYLSYDPGFQFGYDDVKPADLTVDASTSALLMMVSCLQLAGLIRYADDPVRPRAARRTCHNDPGRIPATIEKTDTGYQLVTNGKIKPAKKKSPLQVTCKTKGGKMILDIRPKAKGKSLRSVIGKTVAVGLSSPRDAEEDATVNVSFSKP